MGMRTANVLIIKCLVISKIRNRRSDKNRFGNEKWE